MASALSCSTRTSPFSFFLFFTREFRNDDGGKALVLHIFSGTIRPFRRAINRSPPLWHIHPWPGWRNTLLFFVTAHGCLSCRRGVFFLSSFSFFFCTSLLFCLLFFFYSLACVHGSDGFQELFWYLSWLHQSLTCNAGWDGLGRIIFLRRRALIFWVSLTKGGVIGVRRQVLIRTEYMISTHQSIILR